MQKMMPAKCNISQIKTQPSLKNSQKYLKKQNEEIPNFDLTSFNLTL